MWLALGGGQRVLGQGCHAIQATNSVDFHFGIICNQGNSLKLWGDNSFGVLGLGDENPSFNIAAPNIQNVAAVATGIYHTIILKADGTVWAWGSNEFGQLGANLAIGLDPTFTPVQVVDNSGNPLTNIVQIDAGDDFSPDE